MKGNLNKVGELLMGTFGFIQIAVGIFQHDVFWLVAGYGSLWLTHWLWGERNS